ncbi:MAG: FAD-dependent oxidoreductase [Bacteroidota bacterium]
MKQLVLFFVLLIFVTCSSDAPKSNVLKTDVLVYGAGAAGIPAALQAARDGAKVVLVEPTTWLGGMLTAAGVSAIDGNHNLPSGIWGEFRSKLHEYYGGPEKVATGWVSNTLFEPNVANKIFKEMIAAEPNITLFNEYIIEEVMKEGNKVVGGSFKGADNEMLTVNAIISVDASELGDLMAKSGANYFVGQDPKSRTGEALAPAKVTDYIQDLTYVAILKDYGEGADKTISEPPNYNPENFPCPCLELCADTTGYGTLHACDKMLAYGRLPNNKFMINWPIRGNDFYVNALEMSPEEREKAYEAAKNETLGFVYFLQTAGGYKHLGLADDEFSTEDQLPIIPYHRESRRLDGMQLITVDHISSPYQHPETLYQYGIAVGDYPLDHHRDKGPKPEKIPFSGLPSFSIPFGALVPSNTEGLLVTEKSISTSSLANGSTRLQPCVMITGQATGAAAALSAALGVQPHSLNVRLLQEKLLEANCWILPYLDTQPSDDYFIPLQKVGAAGLLQSEGIPYKWENRTYIYPDSTVSKEELILSSNFLFGEDILSEASTRDTFLKALKLKEIDTEKIMPPTWQGNTAQSFLNSTITRKELAWFIEKIKDPFQEALYLKKDI